MSTSATDSGLHSSFRQRLRDPAEPLPTLALRTTAPPGAAQTDGFASTNSDSDPDVVAKPSTNSVYSGRAHSFPSRHHRHRPLWFHRKKRDAASDDEAADSDASDASADPPSASPTTTVPTPPLAAAPVTVRVLKSQSEPADLSTPASTAWLGRPVAAAPTPPILPRLQYWQEIDMPSKGSQQPISPKSRLLVSDLDNTLFGPSGDDVVARPYLKTFIKYIMHPQTPFALAIWTFSGRMYGLAHLRQVGMGKYLFDSDSLDDPKKKPGLLAFWGYEDSGFLANGVMAAGKPLKDLDLMWQMLNIQTGSDWNPLNSFLVDDQVSNARAQPDNLVNCPVFTSQSPDDDFLLAFVGVLDEIAPVSNLAAAIKSRNLEHGIALEDLDRYAQRGTDVCRKLGIKVSRGAAYPDPTFIHDVKASRSPAPSGPIHDQADEPAEPHPGSFPFGRPQPKRVAKGMTLAPSALYESEVAQPSHVGKVGKPLIIFDLDGTLYTRPPQNLEHDPNGEPSGRPYLRSFLNWLLRPSSPWTVAIWTGSQKATAVRCLWELDLGIVGPHLVGPNKDQAEILHPKIVALWAREDFGLTPEDYHAYVAVVKDLDKMWTYLDKANMGHFGPFNTVMVDDTPSKLRANPDSLIAAPTYDYPLAPSIPTMSAQLDSFLLALVALLDELAPETNFANYIEMKGWNTVQGLDVLTDERKAGVKLLQKAGIAVAAEGRGVLPGTKPSVNDPGYRTAKSTQSGNNPDISSFTLPSSATAASSSLTPSNLSRLPGAQDVTSDTDNDSTDASVDGDSASPTQSRPRTKERFVNEMEALDERRGRPRPTMRDKKKRLDDAVEDWELLGDGPDHQTPRVVPSPFYGNGGNAGGVRQRRDM
ncbi:hypothetical protein JCM1840_001653 [Sporobolomyces johnsonii]